MNETLPDQHVRTMIATELESNFLVEAGAGSGKTTALVGRMLALVRAGVPVERIAAVTFTRKAAAELRERFQAKIEAELREVEAGTDVEGLLASAVRDMERGFVGTVHAFCARLLRERPLEAGIDPAFEEMMEAEHERYQSDFWRVELDRRAVSEDPLLSAVLDAGIQPGELAGVFRTVVENLDVDFPIQAVASPEANEVSRVRDSLNTLIDRGVELLPDTKPAGGWCELQKLVRDLVYKRDRPDLGEDGPFLGALTDLMGWTPKVTLNRWGSSSQAKAQAKELKIAFEEFVTDRSVLAVSDQWLARRYAPAMELLLSMAHAFARERRRTGRLSFQDLLSLTAELLRTHPGARRDLGRRYSRLLIDEFQDTDPIQAEIAFLLASDPDPAQEGAANWGAVRPRPGALFMVGDPKQSIYRFRRADIAVYNAVRERMETTGKVVHLYSNFRSLKSVADMANDVFGALFPGEPSAEQAAYAPLSARRSDADVPVHGVFSYELGGHWRFNAEVARDEAERLAGWIRRRVDAGERSAGDFLILTDRKRYLHIYAHALEAQNLPVDVAGARIEIERGLGELQTVLRSLVDPADPVRTVAVLTGLFFGLDHNALVEHRTAGGRFDCRTASDGPEGPVREALETLSTWWQASLRAPSDVFVTRLVDDLGVIADAAASELGGMRTGALLYALDTVRTAATGGDTSLVGAVEALQTGIDWSDAETPLEPGRPDAVRVMNVHKAKGLEAKVVVLAAPDRVVTSKANLHVSRGPEGEAIGHLEIGAGRWGTRVIARPLRWREFEAKEDAFLEAERTRLRYVAVTRAADELVVGTHEKESNSPWRFLEPWLAEHAQPLESFDRAVGAPPDTPDITPDVVVERIRLANARRSELAAPSYRVASVTSAAKGGASGAPPRGVSSSPPGSADEPGDPPRGFEWGSVVHATLAAAARGVERTDWDAVCRALLLDYGRPLGADGEPVELSDLQTLVESVQSSAVWARAQAADQMLVEAPFATPVDGDPDHLLEGVVDLAFRVPHGWVLVDYKTDVGDDEGFNERVGSYRAQVDLYAEAWTALTHEPVVEKVLFFTTQDREESWE